MQEDEAAIKIGDTSIRLARMGRGRPLLFLHGAGGFNPKLSFLSALAEHYEVIMPEHPGFGTSDDPPALRTVADYALFYLELLETLDLKNAHVVANSLGGWLAAEIAIRDRSRIASLSLLAPAGLKVKGLRPGDTFIWNEEESVRNLYYDQTFADLVLAATLSDQEIDAKVKNRYTVAKLAWQPRWCDPDLEKWLHRIRVPVQLVWGACDRVFPAEYAPHWRALLPDARLHIIENCGHLPHVEKSAETAECILAFVRGIPT